MRQDKRLEALEKKHAEPQVVIWTLRGLGDPPEPKKELLPVPPIGKDYEIVCKIGVGLQGYRRLITRSQFLSERGGY